MKNTHRLPIGDIHIETTLYPRALIEPDWRTVTNYKQAMTSGAVFPPVTVAMVEGKTTLIDGRHRLEAELSLKHRTVRVEMLPALTREQALVEAVRRNLAHGRPLNFRDKLEVAKRMTNWKFQPERIAELLQMPVTELKRYMVSRIVLSHSGKQTIPKPAVAHMGTPPETEETRQIGGDNQVHLLRQVLILLRNGWIDLKQPDVRKSLVEIRKLLGALPLPRAR